MKCQFSPVLSTETSFIYIYLFIYFCDAELQQSFTFQNLTFHKIIHLVKILSQDYFILPSLKNILF